jgi:hypothetical protein
MSTEKGREEGKGAAKDNEKAGTETGRPGADGPKTDTTGSQTDSGGEDRRNR